MAFTDPVSLNEQIFNNVLWMSCLLKRIHIVGHVKSTGKTS